MYAFPTFYLALDRIRCWVDNVVLWNYMPNCIMKHWTTWNVNSIVHSCGVTNHSHLLVCPRRSSCGFWYINFICLNLMWLKYCEVLEKLMTRLNKEWFRERKWKIVRETEMKIEAVTAEGRRKSFWMRAEEKKQKVQKKRFMRDRQRLRQICTRLHVHNWYKNVCISGYATPWNFSQFASTLFGDFG